jgi:hypothetical protein
MCSYNAETVPNSNVNNIPSCANSVFSNDILRGKRGRLAYLHKMLLSLLQINGVLLGLSCQIAGLLPIFTKRITMQTIYLVCHAFQCIIHCDYPLACIGAAMDGILGGTDVECGNTYSVTLAQARDVA